MGNQQPSEAKDNRTVLSENIVRRIHEGELTSRRQVYAIVGRSKSLRLWMDEQGILVPDVWSKDLVKTRLRDLEAILGRLPKASDNWTLARHAQNHFGTWNAALEATFGKRNMWKTSYLSDAELLGTLEEFVKKHRRFPLRSEADGTNLPYWEVYTLRFGVAGWAEVMALLDVDTSKLMLNKHGFGKMYYHEGVPYLSHQEFLIGRYLTEQGISFEKEVPYGPGSKYRFDFYLPSIDMYIEYYGIETAKYRERIDLKRKEYKGRDVLEVFKFDNTVGKVASKVQRL